MQPGLSVSFVFRRKTIAAGEIFRVFDRELAAVTILSGSLEHVKKLERVRILAERRRPTALAVLRVGYPSRSRINLLFECGELSVRGPLSPGMYRTEVLSERSSRLVRDPVATLDPPWPDTLLVRLFDEAADEEIALERGELDAAVFWPGELSSHLRDQPRWRDFLTGTLDHGIVAASWSAADGVRDSSDSLPFAADSLLSSLNREIFGGDLAPWREVMARGGRSLSPAGMGSPDLARFEVDPGMPGHQLVERFLNRSRKPQSARENLSVLRVLYLDLPLAASLPPRTAPLFAIRCPVLAAPQLGPYLAALGPDSLAGMLQCMPAGRRP